MNLDALYRQHQDGPIEQAETALYVAIHNLVRRIVARSIRHDREDLTAEIVLYIWQQMSTRDASIPFEAWVRSVARRRVIDAIRSTYRRPRLTLTEPRTLDRSTETTASGPLREVAAVPGLNDSQRDLLRRFVANPDYASLAAELGVSCAVLRRKLQRLAKKS